VQNSTGVDNFAYVNATTHEVHTLSTTNMTQQNTGVVDYVALDPTTHEIIKTISPTAGIYRGHVPWTVWNQTVVLPGTQTIVAGASVTVVIENHASQGTVPVQVVNVSPGAGGSFQIEASDDPTTAQQNSPGTSYINYIIMNP